MLQSAAYDLERKGTEDHSGENVAAPSKETDATDHHDGDGGEFHALADLRRIDRDLHGVNHARDGGEEAGEDKGREDAPIDRNSNSTCDLFIVANRRELTAKVRPAVDKVNGNDDGQSDERIEKHRPNQNV